ncbi:hypothetical protein [Tychonema sp. LEGE 06208]|uniref:hypothetical protein n=1 Tax=Tychonema sp. LEGE 06208 TaxID=1828663 RepID=UPI0018804CFE|nr:hypothetical protein [Tychonema sp. LEGE 06208]MBE9162973.1 hypothetical protein [Tychonema sp. LEGE 06208]
MQAYKLRGKIDATGNLVVVEPVNMPPGDVEIIVLQLAEPVKGADEYPETGFLPTSFTETAKNPVSLLVMSKFIIKIT